MPDTSGWSCTFADVTPSGLLGTVCKNPPKNSSINVMDDLVVSMPGLR